MADRAFGQGYLGELGARLQRLLGFDGEAGAAFTSTAVPVMLVGDGTLPGYGNMQGRRFAVPSAQIVAATTSQFFMRAGQDLIIERVIVHRQNVAATLGYFTMAYVIASEPDPAAMVARGLFLDRPISTSDRPMVTGNVYAAAAPTQTVLWQPALPANYAAHQGDWQAPFLLATGYALNFFASVDCFVTVYGRTL